MQTLAIVRQLSLVNDQTSVDRFAFVDGYAIERIAYFNPLKVRAAFMRSPAGWWQLLKRRTVGL